MKGAKYRIVPAEHDGTKGFGVEQRLWGLPLWFRRYWTSDHGHAVYWLTMVARGPQYFDAKGERL